MPPVRRSVVATVAFLMGFATSAAPAEPPVEHGSTFETGGVTIWYEVRGDGPGTPLVVANGGPGFDHAYLHCSPVWDRLAKGRKVVFYDQRGNGRSSALKDGTPCGLGEQIADLDALRAHLGLPRIDLLGASGSRRTSARPGPAAGPPLLPKRPGGVPAPAARSARVERRPELLRDLDTTPAMVRLPGRSGRVSFGYFPPG